MKVFTAVLPAWVQPQTRESPQANEQTKENIGLGRINRVVGRSENSGVPVLFGGHNLPLLVEIELLLICQSLVLPWHPRHPQEQQA